MIFKNKKMIFRGVVYVCMCVCAVVAVVDQMAFIFATMRQHASTRVGGKLGEKGVEVYFSLEQTIECQSVCVCVCVCVCFACCRHYSDAPICHVWALLPLLSKSLPLIEMKDLKKLPK